MDISAVRDDATGGMRPNGQNKLRKFTKKSRTIVHLLKDFSQKPLTSRLHCSRVLTAIVNKFRRQT